MRECYWCGKNEKETPFSGNAKQQCDSCAMVRSNGSRCEVCNGPVRKLGPVKGCLRLHAFGEEGHKNWGNENCGYCGESMPADRRPGQKFCCYECARKSGEQKATGRKCKWCHRTDSVTKFKVNSECARCQRQKARSSCSICEGPYYSLGSPDSEKGCLLTNTAGDLACIEMARKQNVQSC